MAIDTSLFGIDLPAGTYTKGDKIELKIIAGPEVVRSGRGAAILKRITVGRIGNVSGSGSFWKVSVKNSDWIDESTSITSFMREVTAFDERSGTNAAGNNCPLTPNSSWMVTAECLTTTTTTVDNSIFCLIDIDYPAVSSIIDPDNLLGIPTSIEYANSTMPINALGDLQTAGWFVQNVDQFKAGYEYALAKIELFGSGLMPVGFIAFSNAAGMGGLSRIIPVSGGSAQIRQRVEYATKLVKGPMDIKFMLFNDSNGSATTDDEILVMDYVKRRV